MKIVTRSSVLTLVIGLFTFCTTPLVSAQTLPTHSTIVFSNPAINVTKATRIANDNSPRPALLYRYSGEFTTVAPSPDELPGGGGGTPGCGINGDSNTGYIYYSAESDNGATAQLGICTYEEGTSLKLVTDWTFQANSALDYVGVAEGYSDGYTDPTPEKKYPSPNKSTGDEFPAHLVSKPGEYYATLTGRFVLVNGDSGEFDAQGPSLLAQNYNTVMRSDDHVAALAP